MAGLTRLCRLTSVTELYRHAVAVAVRIMLLMLGIAPFVARFVLLMSGASVVAHCRIALRLRLVVVRVHAILLRTPVVPRGIVVCVDHDLSHGREAARNAARPIAYAVRIVALLGELLTEIRTGYVTASCITVLAHSLASFVRVKPW